MKASTQMVVAIFAVCSVCMADETQIWTSSATPATLGSLAFTYENGAVQTVEATPSDGGTITLSGDTITFAAGATVTMKAGGKLVFANPVAGAGLTCARTGLQRTYSGTALPAYVEGNPGVLMFENLSLDAVTPVSSQFSGVLSGVARPYFLVREAGRLEVQMQSQYLLSIYNAGQTQSAKLVLVQNGSDIYGSGLGYSLGHFRRPEVRPSGRVGKLLWKGLILSGPADCEIAELRSECGGFIAIASHSEFIIDSFCEVSGHYSTFLESDSGDGDER